MHARASFVSSPEGGVSDIIRRRQASTYAAESSRSCAVGLVSRTAAKSSAACGVRNRWDTRESSVEPWVVVQLTNGWAMANVSKLPTVLSHGRQPISLAHIPGLESYVVLVRRVHAAADSGSTHVLHSGLEGSRENVSALKFLSRQTSSFAVAMPSIGNVYQGFAHWWQGTGATYSIRHLLTIRGDSVTMRRGILSRSGWIFALTRSSLSGLHLAHTDESLAR